MDAIIKHSKALLSLSKYILVSVNRISHNQQTFLLLRPQIVYI